MMLVLPPLWRICHRNGYITLADYVRGRYQSRWLSVAVAVTGILATMPYIALQLIGMREVIAALGIQRGVAADCSLCDSRGLHLLERPARACADRHCERCDALHHGAGGGGYHSLAAGRLRTRVRGGLLRHWPSTRRRLRLSCGLRSTRAMPRLPWDRRWRSCFIRTPSRAH